MTASNAKPQGFKTRSTGSRRRSVDTALRRTRPSRERRGRSNPEPRELPLRLVPDVRDRLQVRLAALGVRPDRIVSHVANLTHRAAQSVRRWFDPETPGLPDLESFARLCEGLGCSADEVIGLAPADQATQDRCRDVAAVADSIYAMTEALRKRGGTGKPMRVPGDEMAPQLHEGDLVFVDTGIDHLAGNGLYALEYDGKLLIRRIEQRLGGRLVLKCTNRTYQDWELAESTAVRRSGLKILGKVQGSIGMRVF